MSLEPPVPDDISLQKEQKSKASALFDRITNRVVDSTVSNIYDRKFSAVPDNPYFFSLFQKQLAIRDDSQIEKVKQLYPSVIKRLFQTATKNAEGKSEIYPVFKNEQFTDNISQEEALWLFIIARSQAEGSPLQQNLMMDSELLPKIIENLSKHLSIPEDHVKSLVWLFQQYLENCAHPSHVSVEMALEIDDKDSALNKILQTALQVKKPSERSKALSSIVSSLALKQSEGKALELLRSVKIPDKNKPLNSILDILLRQGKSQESQLNLEWYQAACDEALSLTNPEDKNRLLQRIAIAVARYGEVNTAYATAAKISASETRAYAYSGIVQALLHIGMREAALQILPAITDNGAKEDAISYIVMDISQKDSYEDVIEFIESLTTAAQRLQGAKVLASILSSHNDKQHAEELILHYSMR
ncbi:MAG: hypothetical protein WC222_07785 [Parachlamydiales bacterium]|jgi:hypothetical protein